MNEAGLLSVPATALTDQEWLRGDLTAARSMFGPVSDRVLGTLRWYSLSSVLVAPVLESLVATGTAFDPSLSACTLRLYPDRRCAGARSARLLGGGVNEAGAAMAGSLGAAIGAIARASGAASPALWAIAGDSISNQLLWAGMANGSAEAGIELAEPLADAIGPPLPRPRFIQVGKNSVVRRSSCCLIYQTGADKCVSCPHQHPDDRDRRLRALFG